MTRNEMSALEDEPRRAEEALITAERLKFPADDKEFEECVNELMESPEKLAAVLDVLDLQGMLLLDQALQEHEAASARDMRPLMQDRPTPLFRERPRARTAVAVFAAVVASASVGAWMYLKESSEVRPTAEPERVALPDSSVMTTDPDTKASVRYSLLARKIELHAGGADFDVDPGGRPFYVNTPLGTAKALGTRFYVRLVGSAQDLKAIVRVRLGTVRLEGHTPSGQPLILAANQQVLLTSDGHGEVADLSKRGQLAEFTGEPLARLAAEFNQRGDEHSPKFLVQGKACWYPVSGSFDLDDWTSLMDYVRLDGALKVSGSSDVIVVTSAADTSPVQSAAQKGCGLDLQPVPVASPASRRP